MLLYYNMGFMTNFQWLPAETVQFQKEGLYINQLSPLADFQLVLFVGDMFKPSKLIYFFWNSAWRSQKS